MAIGTTLKIGFDGSEVRRGLAGLKKGLSGFGNIAASIGKVAAVGVASITALAAGVAAVGIKLNSIGEAANTARARLANIVAQMGLFGDKSVEVTNRLIQYSLATGRQTGMDQKSIQMTQAKLATFAELAETADVAGGAFDRATRAAIDMAASGFGSAEQNAVQLGKALNDPIKGITSLARSGVTFTDKEKEKIRVLVESNKMLKAQDLVLSAIEKQVGGTATATANASEQIKVAMSQVTESFAMAFSNAFTGVPGMMEKMVPQMLAAGEKLGKFTGAAVADAVAGDYTKLTAIGKLIGDAMIVGIQPVFEQAMPRLLESWAGMMEGVHKWLGTDKTHLNLATPLKNYFAGMRENIPERMADLAQQADLAGQYERIKSQRIGLVEGSGGRFRYAEPGESSHIFHRDRSTGQDVMVIEVLKRIEANTKSGSKM
jgi:hypothetical protein